MNHATLKGKKKKRKEKKGQRDAILQSHDHIMEERNNNSFF